MDIIFAYSIYGNRFCFRKDILQESRYFSANFLGKQLEQQLVYVFCKIQKSTGVLVVLYRTVPAREKPVSYSSCSRTVRSRSVESEELPNRGVYRGKSEHVEIVNRRTKSKTTRSTEPYIYGRTPCTGYSKFHIFIFFPNWSTSSPRPWTLRYNASFYLWWFIFPYSHYVSRTCNYILRNCVRKKHLLFSYFFSL